MSAPVLAVGAVAVLALALPVMSASQALESQRIVAAAADAAALAAADGIDGWIAGEPCLLAAQIAHEFGVSIDSCELDETRGEARIVTYRGTIFGRVEARARAGPAGDESDYTYS